MNCNLAKLFAKDRAKSPTEPWNEKELHSIYELNIPAKYVRKGILEVGEYEKVKESDERAEASGDVSFYSMDRDELCRLAGFHEIEFVPGMSDKEIIDLIENAIKDDTALVCDICGFEAKSKIGLISHRRTHKK